MTIWSIVNVVCWIVVKRTELFDLCSIDGDFNHGDMDYGNGAIVF